RLVAREREQLGRTVDRETAHAPADVIRVVMRDERAGERHPVGAQDLDELARRVRRIDRDGFAGFAITDQIDEVDHLLRDAIARPKAPPRQQLPKVKPLHPRYSDPAFPRLIDFWSLPGRIRGVLGT